MTSANTSGEVLAGRHHAPRTKPAHELRTRHLPGAASRAPAPSRAADQVTPEQSERSRHDPRPQERRSGAQSDQHINRPKPQSLDRSGRSDLRAVSAGVKDPKATARALMVLFDGAVAGAEVDGPQRASDARWLAKKLLAG